MRLATTPARQERRTPCASCDRRCLRLVRATERGYHYPGGVAQIVEAGSLLCERCAEYAHAGAPPERVLLSAAARTREVERVLDVLRTGRRENGLKTGDSERA